MRVIEPDTNGIMSNRVSSKKPYMFTSRNQFFLILSVTLDLGRRTFNSQELRRQRETVAILKIYLKNFFGGFDPNLNRPRFSFGHDTFALLSTRASFDSMIGMPSRTG